MASLSHEIPLAAAVDLTTRARQNAVLPVNGWSFTRDIFDAILAQPGAAGIRIYVGQNPNGSVTPVLVATDASGADMTGLVGEEGAPCPPVCDAMSPLSH